MNLFESIRNWLIVFVIGKKTVVVNARIHGCLEIPLNSNALIEKDTFYPTITAVK